MDLEMVDAVGYALGQFQRPGKTAPRLLRDLRTYDPRQPPPGGRHPLTEPPPLYTPGDDFTIDPSGRCSHQWLLKHRQTVVPAIDNAVLENVFKVGVVCLKCRCHAELIMDFEHIIGRPCPNENNLLHHFVYEWVNSSGSADITKPYGSQWKETQAFVCSAPQCGVRLTVNLKDRLIDSEDEILLTSNELLQQRLRQTYSKHSAEFGEYPTLYPTNVLNDLHLYIRGYFNKRPSTLLKNRSKRFTQTFGIEGREFSRILEKLGFKFHQSSDPAVYGQWQTPGTDPQPELPLSDPYHIMLDDWDAELQCLIQMRPSVEKQNIDIQSLENANPVMETCLGAEPYEKVAAARTRDVATQDEHPYYASLGAVADFANNLIKFSYQRQSACDVENESYYLSCLKGISDLRNSSTGDNELEIEYGMQLSLGKTSIEDVDHAFNYFGLVRTGIYEDDVIIGTFKARLEDAPKQEADMRQALGTIGEYRKSGKITALANQTPITTYEQALLHLGVQEDTADDYILTMFGMKTEDQPGDLEALKMALKIIAEKRRSRPIKAFIDTGQIGEVEMDIGEAFSTFNISDRTVDDVSIGYAYQAFANEEPQRRDTYRRALVAIAKAKDSEYLRSILYSEFGYRSEEPQGSHEWPVGLENIGNTCYLNSLLQFYFTVVPLRDIVLNFEKYKMSITPEMLLHKQVGSRLVKEAEVRRSQQFVYALRRLFQNMISSTAKSVTPDQEVALLTLIPSDKVDTVRRQSIMQTRSQLGEIDGRPVLGPVPPPPATTGTSGENPKTNGATQHEADNSSDGTLVSHPAREDVMNVDGETGKKQQDIPNDKENFPPSQQEPDVSPHQSQDGVLTEISPSKLNEQPTSPNKEKGDYSEAILESPINDPPSRTPPPVPPRPLSQEQKAEIARQIDIGAQQDVGEVINNVLFQLEYAIKPQGHDNEGEQLDQVKGLFFGKTKNYLVSAEGKVRFKEEYWTDLKVFCNPLLEDIYSALDSTFDEQDVEIEGVTVRQYGLISKLPPVLSIQVHRVLFNKESGKAYKDKTFLELKEEIYLDRYLDATDEDLMQRRKDCWAWKKELRELDSRRKALENGGGAKGNVPSLLNTARSMVMELQEANQSLEVPDSDEAPVVINPSLVSTVEKLYTQSRRDSKTIEERIKELKTNITSQFTDLRSTRYRLQAVFFHRGGTDYGHYWVCIHDFEKDVWRKYNDGYVTEVVDRNEVFGQQGDNPATPYFVVYVADDEKDRLVQPLCRSMESQTSNNPPADQAMEMDPTEVDEIPGTKYNTNDHGVQVQGNGLQDSMWATGSSSTPVNNDENIKFSFDGN